MHIFKKIFPVFFIVAALFVGPGALWAMSEDQYARIAAENIILMHEANGDSAAIAEKSKEFLAQFSEEEKQEYILMANRVMQDKDLAQRISQRIVNFLIQMGYKVIMGPEGDINSISIGR